MREKKIPGSNLAFESRSAVKLICLCVWEALNVWAWMWKFMLCVKTSVREAPSMPLQLLQCRCMRRCGMAQTGRFTAGTCASPTPQSTAVQSSPVQFSPVQSSPVQSSLVRCSLKCHLSAFVFSSPLGLCCSPTRFTKWTVSGLVLSPLAICSGKIHYSPGESCSALSLHRVYAAAGSIFTLESRTTPSLSCKHIWNLCCTLQHWWLQSYCVITIAILLCRG